MTEQIDEVSGRHSGLQVTLPSSSVAMLPDDARRALNPARGPEPIHVGHLSRSQRRRLAFMRVEP